MKGSYGSTAPSAVLLRSRRRRCGGQTKGLWAAQIPCLCHPEVLVVDWYPSFVVGSCLDLDWSLCGEEGIGLSRVRGSYREGLGLFHAHGRAIGVRIPAL